MYILPQKEKFVKEKLPEKIRNYVLKEHTMHLKLLIQNDQY